MSPIRQTLHHVRAASALAPVRPAYSAGLRAAIATVIPVIVGIRLASGGGIWMSLAGFNGALNDRGGSYRTRAATLAVLTLASAVAVSVGTLAFGHSAISVPLTFALASLCSLARAGGEAGAGVGGSVLVTYVIALAVPPASPHDWLAREGFVLIGGAWAMLLSLVLWPLWPYRPVRRAVAACWRALADYSQELASRAKAGASHDAWSLRDQAVAVRVTLENARTVLATARRGRSGESERGARLLLLTELAEQSFAHLVALGDTLDAMGAGTSAPPPLEPLSSTLLGVGQAAGGIAAAIEAERDPPAIELPPSVRAIDDALIRSPADVEDATTLAQHRSVADLLERVAQYVSVGIAAAASMEGPRRSTPPADVLDLEGSGPPPSRFGPIADAVRAMLTPGPVLVRHALRVGTVTAAAVWLANALGLERGYWATITVVIILQPYVGATTQKALQRVLGTVLGGVLTAGLGALIHDPRAIVALTFVFVAACVAMLPVNYAVYSAFLTPAFVLLAESSVGDWNLAAVRVLNTLIGGALALSGAWLLWPTHEWRLVPDYMAAAVRAMRDYLRLAVAHAAGEPDAESNALRDARRAFAAAAANTEESFQRLLGEHRGPPGALEPLMTFLTYTRRLGVSTGALALGGGEDEPPGRQSLAPFAGAAERVLEDLSDAIIERRAPAPFPAPGTIAVPSADAGVLLRARVTRLSRQLKSLHDAVDHWIGAS